MEISNEKRIWTTTIYALLLAVANNYLFYGEPLGISYPLFVLLFYVFYFTRMKDKLDRLWDFSWFLFVVIIALSMSYFLFTNLIFYILNFMAIPVLIAFHTTIFARTRNHKWHDLRMVANVVDHVIPQSLRNVPTPFRRLANLLGAQLDTRLKTSVVKVMIGLIISLPILLIVIQLLSSADKAFGQLLSGIPEWMSAISIGEGFLRFIWILVLFPYIFGFVWGLVDPKKYQWESSDKQLQVAKDNSRRISWDPIIVMTVLIGINLVYVLFTFVQFSYLFGAFDGALPDGTTYAEHARSGFLELVAVGVINFLILIGTLNFVAVNDSRLSRWNRSLLTLLVTCTGIMLVSAFIRLQLYEEVFGYTYIRFLVHAFMIYLGVLLLISGIRIWRLGVSLFRCFAVISLLAYVMINYVGMDRIIASNNIERYRDGMELDTQYLNQLSLEAVPLLIELSREDEGVIVILQEKYEQLAADHREWVSFNWSRYQTMKELEHELRK